MAPSSDRREFLKTSATTLAGAAALASSHRTTVAGEPSDRIRVAVVGLRGRGQRHLDCVARLADQKIELATICDCDTDVLAKQAHRVEQEFGMTPQRVTDLRAVLDDPNIDAVSYATPNHWHALGTVWACQAGKDVYVEKPGSHNIFEGRKMVEAARKYGRMVQHGTQCRSSPNIREAIAKLREGVIGDVYMARGVAFKVRGSIGKFQAEPVPASLDYDAWLGPAPERPYSSFANRRWHNVWDYGNGELGNQGVHQLDMIRWGLGLDSHPTMVQSMGGDFLWDDDQETPSTQSCGFEFGGRKIMVEFAVRNGFTNPEAGMGTEYPFVDNRNVCGVIFLGTEGYLIIPDYTSYYTFLGRKREKGPWKSDRSDPMIDQPHFENFFQACRSRNRTELFADIEQGHLSSALAHLANVAYRTKESLHFDPENEVFTNKPDANLMLTREYRAPYVVPETV